MKNYSVKELAAMAGITSRTLRYYDKIGLLVPSRIGTGDYRKYTEQEVDRLQEILLYKELGLELSEIKTIIEDPKTNREERLKQHLDRLMKRKIDLDILIKNVENTIKAEKGEITMNDEKKFQGMKKNMIDENEKMYGEEIREKYGDNTIDESNRKMMNLSKQDFEDLKTMAAEINLRLENAVTTNISPESEEGIDIAKLHRKWLDYSWPQYSEEAHLGLTEMYLGDERFKSYYDSNVKGCAQFLHDAVKAMINSI